MNCPQCNFKSTTAINAQKDRYYCPKCKHTWIVGKEKESLENKGSVEFSGVLLAKTFLENIARDNSISPEIKSAFIAQLTASFFEQWYEGFKAGLLADIVHSKGALYDGKNRTEPGTANRESGAGDRGVGNSPNQDGFPGPATGAPPRAFERVKESINGVVFLRPKHLHPTEEQLGMFVIMTEKLGLMKQNIEEVYFNGVHFLIKFGASPLPYKPEPSVIIG